MHTMDADVPQLTAASDPSPSPLSSLDVPFRFPFNKPGMGIPCELWNHIINFLELEPYPLLACCLTCRSFWGHTHYKLIKLSSLSLFLDKYTDINRLVDEVRTIPGRAQTIREFSLSGKPALAFSIVSHRLASQLVNLSTFHLSYISEVPDVPSSTWFLYGRAFSSVASLHLHAVQFPSFMDFVRLVTSFHALQSLRLDSISCVHPGTPPNTLRSPRKLKPLEHFELQNMNEDGGHFLRSFIHWFISRGSIIRRLNTDSTAPSHPSGFLLIHKIHAHLHALSLGASANEFLMEVSQKSRRNFLGERHPLI